MKNNYNLKNKIIKALLMFVLTLFINIKPCFSQTWQWAKGGGGTSSDVGSETCVDAAGNVFVAGYFSSSSIMIGTVSISNSGVSGSDIFIAKYNSAGVLQWTQRIGGSASEYVSGLCADASGRIYIIGYYTSGLISLPPFSWGNLGAPTSNVFLACIDGAGVPQWLNGYGGTGNEYAGGVAYSNAVAAVYFVGTYFDPTLTIGTTTLNNTSVTGKAEVFLVKVNSSGTMQWARTTGAGTSDDWGGDIAVDAVGYPCFGGTYSPSTITGSTVIGAQTLNSTGFQEMYIAKYTDIGNFQFARSFGSVQGGDFFGGITVDASNSIYISGTFQNASLVVGTYTVPSSGNYDAFIAKYSSAAVAQWVNKIGGTLDDYGNDLAVDGGNNIYIAGSYSGTVITVGTATLANTTPGPSLDAFIAKYNSGGVFQWTNKAIGAGSESGSGIASDIVGNVYVTGAYDGPTAYATTTLSTAGVNDFYIAKIGCLTTSVTGVSNVCFGSSITLTGSGATTYTWNTGASTPSITISPTVTTSYTVTGIAGACVGTQAVITVTVLPASVNTGPNLNLLCKQKQQIAATCNPPLFPVVVWTPTTGLSSSNILTPTVTAGGLTTYSVTVTLNNGCIVTKTLSVGSYAQTPDICMVTVDSLGVNNEIYWDKTSYPQADSFVIYRETSLNVYKRIGAVSRNQFSMYTDTNRSIGPANGDPNLTYYKYKMQIKDSCSNISLLSKWHETIFVQDQLNGNFNWNAYAIELAVPPVSIYNLKRRNLTTGTETIVVSTVGSLATDPQYATVWPTNIKWFVDAIGFNCNPTPKGVDPNQILLLKTKTKSNQSNDKLLTYVGNPFYSDNNLKVYPNPAKENLTIEINIFDKSETSLEIKNLLGQTIYQTKVINQITTINTALITSGVYFVNVKQNDKLMAVKKVMVDN